jgi:hypothetical protein
MKTLLFTCTLLLSSGAFSQNKIYTITEQYSAANTTLDKIIVTTPDGTTTAFDITHFMLDVAKHDSEFNKILNNVLSTGCELLNPSPNAHGDMNMKAGMSIFTRTWFLSHP